MGKDAWYWDRLIWSVCRQHQWDLNTRYRDSKRFWGWVPLGKGYMRATIQKKRRISNLVLNQLRILLKLNTHRHAPGKKKNIDSQPHFFHFLPELLKMTEIVIGNNNFIVKTWLFGSLKLLQKVNFFFKNTKTWTWADI